MCKAIAFKIKCIVCRLKRSPHGQKQALRGSPPRTKPGVKVFTICMRSPYKPLRKQLIYSQLKIKFFKICPFLTIFLNTYS